MMWWRSVRPRIHSHLPTGTVLEVAPGYGRWTLHLIAECQQLIAVDLTPRCIDVCRERFAGEPRAEFWVNDGESLPMVASSSVDFAFSLDSLVHVEEPQIRRYLEELARTLKPGGTAFLHHSNLAAYAERSTGRIPAYVTERHWRARSMSARAFRDACRAAGLVCVTQEVINWIGRDAVVDRYRLPSQRIPLTDCLSTCVRPLDGAPAETRVHLNRRFVNEWREMIELTALYTAAKADGTPAADRADTTRPPYQRVTAVRRAIAGRIFELREPMVGRLRRLRCPDCGGRVSHRDGRSHCAPCRVTYTVS
jgi:SAM-dependent methyltransferase